MTDQLPDPAVGQHASATPALLVNDLSLTLNGLRILADVNMVMERGQTLGIVGPNGAGKTSLLNCVSGLFRVQMGSIAVNGMSTAGLKPHAVARLGLGRTFQSVECFKDFTVIELAMLGGDGAPGSRLNWRLRRSGGTSGISGGGGRGLSQATAVESLELLGLVRYAHSRLGDLPYGIAKLADFARALSGHPAVLLLDEPAAGLEVSERRALVDIIHGVRESRDVSIGLVEHDIGLVSDSCPQLLVMAEGQRKYLGPTTSAMTDNQIRRIIFGDEKLDRVSGIPVRFGDSEDGASGTDLATDA